MARPLRLVAAVAAARVSAMCLVLAVAGIGLILGQAPPAHAAPFQPGTVLYADGGGDGQLMDVTAGGDLSGASPLSVLDGRSAGQVTWSPDLTTAYVGLFDLDRIVAVSGDGTVSAFATGIDQPTGLLMLDSGQLLAASFSGDAVFDISGGGDFSSATPWASGLDGPRNILQVATGEVLVALANVGQVMDISSGGSYAAATPFALGLGEVNDLVQDGTGRVFVSQRIAARVTDISAGGDFSAATPFATGREFMGLTVDGSGRLLANAFLRQQVFDISAGGDFSTAAPFALGIPAFGESGLDTVPSAVPEPGSGLLLAAGLAGLSLIRRRRGAAPPGTSRP